MVVPLGCFFLFLKDCIYLFMRDTKREAETQAGGEAGSMQGARHGTRSQVSRIMPWAEGVLNRWATGAAQACTFMTYRPQFTPV